jgi:hypothetical protein
MNRKHQEEWQSTTGKKHSIPYVNFICKKKMIVEGEQKPVETSDR